MANTKASAFPSVTAVAGADSVPVIQGGVTSKATATVVRGYLTNASITGVAAGYAVDTYLAGSASTIATAGGWKAGTIYRCRFDMTKTATGTAAFTIIVRMGTLGTTGDAAILTLSFAAGTAAADTAWIELDVTFRSVGSGAAAVIQGVVHAGHNLAATGVFSTGAAGYGTFSGTSGGFASTTQTVIGISVNGGAAFSGTNSLVQTELLNI